MKMFLILSLIINSARAYVPTVESLFRNSGNPDVTTNGVEINLKARSVIRSSQAGVSLDTEEHYVKIIMTIFDQHRRKMAQLHFSAPTMNQSSLTNKKYFSNFGPYTIKNDMDNLDRGIFFGLLVSMLTNDGSFMVQYLKSKGIPVKLNSEIINNEKKRLMERYKVYLKQLAGSPNKAELVSPLKPIDPDEKKKVDELVLQSLYHDIGQVSTELRGDQLFWVVRSGDLTVHFDYYTRQLRSFNFAHETSPVVVEAKDFWKANGVNEVPKVIVFKTAGGDTWELEITNLRHFNIKEVDWVNRLKDWDKAYRPQDSARPTMFF